MGKYKIPFTFVAGTRARASQVNKNFESLVDAANDLDDTKAAITGNSAINFNVAEPVNPTHAVTKRYVDQAIDNSAGGDSGSGVGKSIFEVFHTLSSKTPAGAFSLRSGELLLRVDEDYPTFWEVLQTEGVGLIPDFTDTVNLPAGYTATFTNLSSVEGNVNKNRAFSPYSWVTSTNIPTSSNPIALELQLPSVISCKYFKINSHVYDTYNSVGLANSSRAIKNAAISIRRPDGQWVVAAIIDETKEPLTNERYFKNEQPNVEFNAIRLVVSESFSNGPVDLSIYPVDPDKTTIRVVSEEQWQWEVASFGETGSFVINTQDKTVRLPKVNRFLSGVSDLWQIGIPEAHEVSKTGIRWQDGTLINDFDENDDPDSKISLNSVRAGLWIQVYNAVADKALSNIRYIPNATLLEERLFSFVPDPETGWYISDGQWKDGNFFTEAMSKLLNASAQAVQVSNQNYKVAPNAMRFVTEEVYQSTLTSYGECPYYVVDAENNRFKTPMSRNFFRATDNADDVGNLELDAAPDITGCVGAVPDNGIGSSGCCYREGTSGRMENTEGAPDPNVYIKASLSHESYGRGSDEIRPRNSRKIMCVFLGNEVPQSSAVDVFVKMKSLDARIDTNTSSIEQLESAQKESKEEVNSQLSDMNRRLGDVELGYSSVDDRFRTFSEQLDEAEENISSFNDRLSGVDSRFSALQLSVNDIKEAVTLSQEKVDGFSDTLDSLNSRTDLLEKTSKSHDDSISSISSTISELQAADSSMEQKQESLLKVIEQLQSTIQTLQQELLNKAEESKLLEVESRFNGLTLKKLTQEEYDLEEPKDQNTLYIIVGGNDD